MSTSPTPHTPHHASFLRPLTDPENMSRDKVRRQKGVGFWGRELIPNPQQSGGFSGSAVTSPNGIQGRSLATRRFVDWSLQTAFPGIWNKWRLVSMKAIAGLVPLVYAHAGIHQFWQVTPHSRHNQSRQLWTQSVIGFWIPRWLKSPFPSPLTWGIALTITKR